MQFRSVKELLVPLVRGGHEWQSIDINGVGKTPSFYFSGVQWCALLLSAGVLLRMTSGVSNEILGYVMSAFSISVSLFMSLLVSIFDKFESTDFMTEGKDEEAIVRLKQKKNFFKRFISITSYLVVLSILIIVLCSLTYLFEISNQHIHPKSFIVEWHRIDVTLTVKNAVIITYRIILNYFLLNYLFLTLFVAGSAYEYYISELNRRTLE